MTLLLSTLLAMVTWTQTLEKQSEEWRDRIVATEGVKQLTDGTLPEENFALFIKQDNLYLEEFRKSIVAIGDRIGGVFQKELNRMAYGSVEEEMKMQAKLDEMFHWSKLPDIPIDVTASYCGFQRESVTKGSIGEGVASLLACFWTFFEVTMYIGENCSKDNPYSYWIESYSNPALVEDINAYRAICDAIAAMATPEEREKMTKAFERACQYEYEFYSMLSK